MASLPFSRPVFLSDNNFLVDNNRELISELPDATPDELALLVQLINSAPDPAARTKAFEFQSTIYNLPPEIVNYIEALRYAVSEYANYLDPDFGPFAEGTNLSQRLLKQLDSFTTPSSSSSS